MLRKKPRASRREASRQLLRHLRLQRSCAAAAQLLLRWWLLGVSGSSAGPSTLPAAPVSGRRPGSSPGPSTLRAASATGGSTDCAGAQLLPVPFACLPAAVPELLATPPTPFACSLGGGPGSGKASLPTPAASSSWRFEQQQLLERDV